MIAALTAAGEGGEGGAAPPALERPEHILAHTVRSRRPQPRRRAAVLGG
jgi:hypothetical protein